MSSLITVLLLSILSSSLIAQELYMTPKRLWKPQQDDVYLQEVAKKIPTEQPVQELAVHEGHCFAVIGEKIWLLNNDFFNNEKNAPSGVKRLISVSGDLWALASDGIHRLKNNKWEIIDKREFVDICIHNVVLHEATEEEVYRLADNKFVSIKPEGGYYS